MGCPAILSNVHYAFEQHQIKAHQKGGALIGIRGPHACHSLPFRRVWVRHAGGSNDYKDGQLLMLRSFGSASAGYVFAYQWAGYPS